MHTPINPPRPTAAAPKDASEGGISLPRHAEFHANAGRATSAHDAARTGEPPNMIEARQNTTRGTAAAAAVAIGSPWKSGDNDVDGYIRFVCQRLLPSNA